MLRSVATACLLAMVCRMVHVFVFGVVMCVSMLRHEHACTLACAGVSAAAMMLR
jgi:hypothetical protein